MSNIETIGITKIIEDDYFEILYQVGTRYVDIYSKIKGYESEFIKSVYIKDILIKKSYTSLKLFCEQILIKINNGEIEL